jgi:hypothetical protein
VQQRLTTSTHKAARFKVRGDVLGTRPLYDALATRTMPFVPASGHPLFGEFVE